MNSLNKNGGNDDLEFLIFFSKRGVQAKWKVANLVLLPKWIVKSAGPKNIQWINKMLDDTKWELS